MSRLERILLHASIALAAASGIVYVVMRDLLPRSDPFSVLGHPWQPHVLAAHVLVAPFFVFALGLIAREHILERVRNGRSPAGRRSGIVTILLALPMIVSGYGVQVVTAPFLRRGLGIAHLASGLAFALLYGVHLLRAYRRRPSGKGWQRGPADRLSA
jgi:hypothetical protein